MIVEPSARNHGIRDADVRHAFRHHWRRIETDDVDVTMYLRSCLAMTTLSAAGRFGQPDGGTVAAVPGWRNWQTRPA